MRRLALGFLLLVLALGGALGFALWNAQSYLNRHRAWIEARASAATGRRVSLGEIGVSVWGGLGASIADLEIADDPEFSDEPFVEAALVRVEVAILPALLGRVEVRDIVVEAPTIRVIRGPRGMNYATLGPAPSPDAKAPRSAEAALAEAEPAGEAGRALSLLVALLTIRDGEVHFADRTVTPPARQTIRHLDVRATGVAGADPVAIELAAAVLGSEDRNVRLRGEVGPLRLDGTQAPASIPLDLSVDMGPLAWGAGREPLEGSIAAEGSVGELRVRTEMVLADLRVAGDGTVEVGPPLAADLRLVARAERLPLAVLGVAPPGDGEPEMLRDLRATGRIEAGDALRFAGELRIAGGLVRDVAFENLHAVGSLAGEVASLDEVELALFGGTYEGSGRYDFRDPGAPRFAVRQQLHDLDVAELLASRVPGAAGRVTGRLAATLEVSGVAASPEALPASIEGGGEVAVTGGVLRGVNLPDLILERLTGLGGLTNLLSRDLRERYVEVFSGDDTPFDELSATLEIDGGRATTDDAVITARDYSLRGAGSVAFDGEMDFVATFIASEGLTDEMVGAARELRHLVGRDGRFAVPVRITGVLPRVTAEPDAAALARGVTRGAVAAGLELLGVGSNEPKDRGAASHRGQEPEDAEAGSSRGHEADAGQGAPGSEVEVIERGLRSLFGD